MSIREFPIDLATDVSSELVKFAHAIPQVEEELIATGAVAWLAQREFEERFCSKEDIGIHRSIELERAKELISEPRPRLWYINQKKQYTAVALEKIRRDISLENGVPYAEITKHFPREEWKAILSPCRRRLWKERVLNSEFFQKEKAEFERAYRAAFGRELDFLLPENQGKIETRGFLEVVREVVEKYAGYFQYDSYMGRKEDPAFSFRLDENWKLAVVIDDKHAMAIRVGTGYGSIKLLLLLAVSDRFHFRAATRKDERKFLLIDPSIMFSNYYSYCAYKDARELEFVCLRQLSLINIMVNMLQNELKSCISRHPIG